MVKYSNKIITTKLNHQPVINNAINISQ